MMKRLAFALVLSLWCGAASATALFAVCSTACTWDGSSTAMWSTSSGGATGSGPPGVSDTVTLDASTCVGGTTCTITVNTNPTITTLTMGACTASTTGCILDFSAHNNNITISGNNGFAGQGTGHRTLNMGNGTWTMSGSAGGNTWRLDNTTNLTFNANGSTLKFSNNGVSYATMLSNALTYATMEIAGSVQLPTSSLTIGTLKLDGGSYTAFGNLVTYTVSTAFTVTSSSSSPVGLASNSQGSQATLVLPASTTMAWVSLRDINFTGSGSSPTATNSFNLGDLTNISVTGPSAGGGGACIIGGWLLWRDMPRHINDDFPAFLEKAG